MIKSLKMPAKRKTPRDPDAPKKPSSAFFFYLKEQQWVVRAEMLERDPGQVSIPNSIVAKECGRRWQQLDEHTRSNYVEQHQLAKSIYEEKFRQYLAEKESKEAAGDPNVATVNVKPEPNRQKPSSFIPKLHEEYFIFLESSWRKTSMSMPGLSPLEIQNRLWQIWQLQSAEEQEDRPPQNPIQFCEGNC